jgi:hypothetical protein
MAYRDRVSRVAPHHLEGGVGATQMNLALPLATAIRIAPLPLAHVVPVCVLSSDFRGYQALRLKLSFSLGVVSAGSRYLQCSLHE